MKYIKRPVILEAFQYKYKGEIPQWAAESPDVVLWEGFLTIDTLEGTMRADEGDYVIQGIDGEIYPCKPHIFEQLYDLFIPLNGDENVSSSSSDSL